MIELDDHRRLPPPHLAPLDSAPSVPAIPVAIINHPSLPKSQQFVTISYGGAPSPDRLVSDIHKKWPSAMV